MIIKEIYEDVFFKHSWIIKKKKENESSNRKKNKNKKKDKNAGIFHGKIRNRLHGRGLIRFSYFSNEIVTVKSDRIMR